MGKIQIKNFDGVYEPAEDSWLMAKHIPQFQGSVLEIGCGSGIISMHLAQRGNVVTAIDINPKAVEATKFNSKENDLEIEVLEGDLVYIAKDIMATDKDHALQILTILSGGEIKEDSKVIFIEEQRLH